MEERLLAERVKHYEAMHDALRGNFGEGGRMLNCPKCHTSFRNGLEFAYKTVGNPNMLRGLVDGGGLISRIPFIFNGICIQGYARGEFCGEPFELELDQEKMGQGEVRELAKNLGLLATSRSINEQVSPDIALGQVLQQARREYNALLEREYFSDIRPTTGFIRGCASCGTIEVGKEEEKFLVPKGSHWKDQMEDRISHTTLSRECFRAGSDDLFDDDEIAAMDFYYESCPQAH